MIKDHNLLPIQEARLGDIQQHKLLSLVWWAKERQCHGLAIIAPAWTTSELKSSTT